MSTTFSVRVVLGKPDLNISKKLSTTPTLSFQYLRKDHVLKSATASTLKMNRVTVPEIVSKSSGSGVLPVPFSHTPSSDFVSSTSTSSSSSLLMLDDYPLHEKLEDNFFVGILIVSLVFIVIVALTAGTVFYCMQHRKRLDDLRHRLIPVYNFAPGEEEEWGVLLDPESQSIRNFHP